jgi:hypothetical protein
LRNQRVDASRVRFDCRSGYYGEAFGIFRALEIQGYGYFGPTNIDGEKDRGTSQPEQNFRWWFSELEDEVLEEENFRGDGRCEYCLERWRKDDRSIAEKNGFRPVVNEGDEGHDPKFGMDKPKVLG